MAFSFRNMQIFIRNCLEPHLAALYQVMKSSDGKLKKEVELEIDLLKKQLKAYQDLMDNRFNDLNQEVDNRLDTFSTIPVGIVAIWTSPVAPIDAEKWFDCDGSRYDQSRYPDLFKILKSVSLPDYRGLFLRGVGGNSAALGVLQSDRIRNITG